MIEVESCAKRLQEVVAAGGEHILGPHEIPNMGVYGQVKDSEGIRSDSGNRYLTDLPFVYRGTRSY